jgi:Tfp pilus assembly protein PilF
MTRLADALAAHKQGQLAAAEQMYRSLLKREKLNFDANNLLGTLLCQQQRFADGLPFLEKAVKAKPGAPGARLNLGHALAALGKDQEAEASYRAALKAAPRDILALAALSRLLVKVRRPAEAEALLRKAAGDIPLSADIAFELGELLAVNGKMGEAVESLRRALALAPSHRGAERRLAILAAHDGQYIETIPVLEKLGNDIEGLVALGRAYRQAQDAKRAMETARRAERLAPEHPDVKLLLATLLGDGGDLAGAQAIFESLLKTGQLEAEALSGLAMMQAIKPKSDTYKRLMDLNANAPPDAAQARSLGFAAAQTLDAEGRYEEAFAHYLKAHAIGRQPFDAVQYSAFVADTIASFDKELLAKLKDAGSASAQPIFIVGLPRSGTSLVEQILASHPDVQGAGELEEMRHEARGLGFSYAHAKSFAERLSKADPRSIGAVAERYLAGLAKRGLGKRFVTDKMPHNFEIVGFIAAVFPKARFLRCERDAADTCVSIFTQNFGSAHRYADDLAALGAYFKDYARLMKHWQALLGSRLVTVQYEELVASPEREIRTLLSSLGLPWDERCLAFHTTDRTVSTFSRVQVRQPISSSSIGRWKRYEPQLAPLLKALA